MDIHQFTNVVLRFFSESRSRWIANADFIDMEVKELRRDFKRHDVDDDDVLDVQELSGLMNWLSSQEKLKDPLWRGCLDATLAEQGIVLSEGLSESLTFPAFLRLMRALQDFD